MDQIISWETAKLAKEKGFNIPVSRYYRDEKLVDSFIDPNFYYARVRAHSLFIQSKLN